MTDEWQVYYAGRVSGKSFATLTKWPDDFVIFDSLAQLVDMAQKKRLADEKKKRQDKETGLTPIELMHLRKQERLDDLRHTGRGRKSQKGGRVSKPKRQKDLIASILNQRRDAQQVAEKKRIHQKQLENPNWGMFG